MKLLQLLSSEYSGTVGLVDIRIQGVEYDSRKVGIGSLFVAIKGYETDGHLFIQAALDAGAVAIVLEDASFMIDSSTVQWILVEDSRKALAEISSRWFGDPGKRLVVIGVTGTNGKTSVTYMLKSILQASGRKVGVIGTIENQIGDRVLPSMVTTPESRDLQELLSDMVKEGCSHCLMEASSHALYLDRVWGIPFRGAIFTNLTQDHLDFHVDMKGYLEAKRKLFGYVKSDGFCIVNMDDPSGASIQGACGGPVTTYGFKDGRDLMAKDIQLSLDGARFNLLKDGVKQPIALRLLGEFSVYNALAAIGAALGLGIGLREIQNGLSGIQVNGRFQVVESSGDFAVVVDYAHTPDGLKNVLNTARKITKGKIICVFGCGGDRDQKKRPIMGEIAGELADRVIITSDNPRTEDPSSIIAMIEEGVKTTREDYQSIENRKDAIGAAISMATAGDLVLIAGKGHEDYQIIGKTKHHFSDVEVAQEYLEKGPER